MQDPMELNMAESAAVASDSSAAVASDSDTQPPRRAASQGSAAVDGAAAKKKKPSWWSRGPVIAGLLGSLFGLLGSLIGLGVIWGGSQASATTTADKVKVLEQALESRADKATAEKLAQTLESKADRAVVEKQDERLRAQEVAGADLKATNTAEHKSMEQRVEAMERNIDTKLDKVLARLK